MCCTAMSSLGPSCFRGCLVPLSSRKLAKWLPFSILDFGVKRPKNSPKEPQEAITRSINSAFWMELNITLKIFSILHFIVPK